MSIGHPIPEIWLFLNLTLKIQGQGHGRGEHWKSQHGPNILSTHIPFVPCQTAIPFIRYDFFKIWPWKSKVKVMGEGKVESHNMGPTFYRLTSLWFHVNRLTSLWFHVNRHPIPEIRLFQNLTLKIKGQGHGWCGHWKSQHGCNIL